MVLDQEERGFPEKRSFQKLGFYKYDAFEENGGKLSTILVMLDEKNNGYILNFVHGNTGKTETEEKLRNICRGRQKTGEPRPPFLVSEPVSDSRMFLSGKYHAVGSFGLTNETRLFG